MDKTVVGGLAERLALRDAGHALAVAGRCIGSGSAVARVGPVVSCDEIVSCVTVNGVVATTIADSIVVIVTVGCIVAPVARDGVVAGTVPNANRPDCLFIARGPQFYSRERPWFCQWRIPLCHGVPSDENGGASCQRRQQYLRS